MRLIDADEFNKQEVLEKLRTAEFDDEIKDVVEKIPTAYDVDKVTKELNVNFDITNWGKPYGITLEKATEIVKSGGVAD